jgi:photosystem II stability/assembly factor-like uncharacterized protein
MEILTLPVGLVVGLFPVFVDLGPQGGAATLLLDGRPACSLTAEAPGCMVDLGALPRIHTLDLRRTDESGRVVEEIHRYLNRGFIGVVRALGDCDDARGTCAFQIQAAHPGRLNPASVAAHVDGRPARIVGSMLTFPNPKKSPPQVLTLEAIFPDGGRAEFTRLLHGSYPEETEARLTAVPIETRETMSAADLEKTLKEAGWPLRAVEQGPADVLFAVEPGAFRSTTFGARFAARRAFVGTDRVRFLSGNESLESVTMLTRLGHPEPWTEAIEKIGRAASVARVRTADAVAVAGFSLNASSRRRIAVLILASEAVEARSPDTSTFTRAGALAYLRDAGVPLAVWRTGEGGPSPSWPDETRLEKDEDLASAAMRVRERLDRQWTAWLEAGASELSLPPLPDGIARAGGARTIPSAAAAPAASSSRTSPVDVYGLAEDSVSGTVFAATGQGLFWSRDAGETWSRRPELASGPVFAVAANVGAEGLVLAGASRAVYRLSARGATTVPLPGVQALAVQGSPGSSALLATARGQVCSTTDAGRGWKCGGVLSASYAASVSVDAADASVAYASTMGSGAFVSRDGGREWTPLGNALKNSAVRAVVRDASTRTLYAATDGGLFASADGGRWDPLTSFPRTMTYALAFDPADARRLFAATQQGLYESADGGASWALRPLPGPASVATCLLAARGRLYVGTLGAGVVEVPLDSK